jgi:soluble lytic murein transglycosylase
MAFLMRRYESCPALVPAAYNAGQGAVDRWLRGREGGAFDELVEEIPFDETRRYARRVLQSYGVYSWLDTGRLPVMPERLPR